MKAVQYFSILVGAGSLAWEYYAGGYAIFARWILLFGLVWLLAEFRHTGWLASAGFPICVAVAGVGLWLDLSLGWMLAGALGALIAWDLADFIRRVEQASAEDDVPTLTRRHLLRLTIITFIGLALSLVGMVTRLEFSFEWTAFLALLAALGVTQLVSWMKKGE